MAASAYGTPRATANQGVGDLTDLVETVPERDGAQGRARLLVVIDNYENLGAVVAAPMR